MKKLITLLLVLVLCLSVTGCRTNKKNGTEKETENTESVSQETKPTETESKETEPTETEPKETEPTETEPKETEPTETEPKETEPVEQKPETSGSTPLLYKATDDNGTMVWLFGSIHLSNDNMYPLPDYVMDAYEQSEALAVEADPIAVESDMGALTDILMQIMYMDGTTISDHIDEDLYNNAVKILNDQGYYSVMLDYYMPSMWYSLIESLQYIAMGLEEETGIDRYLLTQAKDSGKEILEIESMAGHYKMLADFSPELQELLLEGAVEAFGTDDGTEQVEVLVKAWCEGDGDTVADMAKVEITDDVPAEQIPLIEEYNKVMITDRNILMADYAEDALENDENIFICVGLAHIVGDGGMVDLLTQRGYTVEKVN